MQANTCNLCNAKVSNDKHGTPGPFYKGLKEEFCSTNNVEYRFWFSSDNIKRYVSGNKKRYVLDWPIVPSTWLVKIGTNLLT